MKKLDYPKIYSDLTKNFPKRVKEVLVRRFGIEKREPGTLESIGKNFKITRERVRQIQEQSFLDIKRKNKAVLKEIFQNFSNYFERAGNLKREDIALADLGGEDFQRYISFFLCLGDSFFRYYDKKEYFSFWSTNQFPQKYIRKMLNLFIEELESKGKLMTAEKLISEISLKSKLKKDFLFSVLQISKEVGKNSQNFYGLKSWPEIHPRGVKDEAFLTFGKEKKPLHFLKVAQLISSKTLCQTVHNELIKDPRFVLVGRGIYALREWGYESGTVKDIILKILKESKKVLTKEEIIKKVSAQRIVKENTILMNLNDKKYFLKDSQEKYSLRKTKLA